MGMPRNNEKLGGGLMIEEREFRGHSILILKRSADDKYPFQFGLGKAKLIVEHYEAIKKWLEENKTEEV
jgi:hypothetical protein